HPEAIAAVHRAYFAAGSDIVYAPTFGGNPLKLAEFGLEKRTSEINSQLVRLCRANAPGKLIFGDIAPTGQLVEPFGELGFEACVDNYKQQIAALAAGGADGLVIETMMDLQEARAALIAARETAPELPVIVTMTFEPGGRTLTGNPPEAALVTLQALGADAFGCNCSTGPEEMAEIVRRLKPCADIPLVAKPNAGMPHLRDGKTVFDLAPEEFARLTARLVEAGASIIGGCCGTTPEHIAALKRAVSGMDAPKVGAKLRGVVASAQQFRRLNVTEPFAVIGERINPTGKKLFQGELRAGKLEIAKRFAAEQTAQGAAILDVNFGLAGIDEADTMRRAVGELVKTTPLPLAIDTVNSRAAEAALRLYPGRALFNSVSGEQDRLEQVLPIAAKYGAMLILLPLDDNGIPATAEARLDVLDKILLAAARYGYKPADCVADALIMTVSAEPLAAQVSLEFIRRCHDERKMNTVCGLSNVSFGLPGRPQLNLAFLGMALGNGLNLAIANPGAPGIMDLAASRDALTDCDERLERYLRRFTPVPAAATAPAAPAADAKPALAPKEELSAAVVAGRKEAALAALARALDAGDAPQKLVDDVLIPAITVVGEKFEKKEYYLPQLLQSAEAMKAAMGELEPRLLDSGNRRADGPVFVLATVQGDIHDIGKNIFSLLLRNHGFNVIDLGKDVPAATIAEAARQHHAAIVGLSALMTTTMPRMKEVVELFKAENLDIPIFVGGAAVDATFAESIGAYYGSDAMSSVRLALKVVAERK
ncbi:MAG: homocysteine S-methyltransferase family protein, partial [Lentisphaeria bacterium]|nr:homocysteine S-methyltransferase family protein [Lentisphaeria bacterium]